VSARKQTSQTLVGEPEKVAETGLLLQDRADMRPLETHPHPLEQIGDAEPHICTHRIPQ